MPVDPIERRNTGYVFIGTVTGDACMMHDDVSQREVAFGEGYT